MKKITVIDLIFFFVASPAFAKVERVGEEVSFWDLVGSYIIEFFCISGCGGTYSHTMNVDSHDTGTGEFSGDGYYNPDPGYTWDLEGTLVGNVIDALVTYTGIGAGYTVDLEGAVAADGTLSGLATSSSDQTFTWESVAGAATEVEPDLNHGQYVRSQENKREAAQSRIGMPVQSKGHRK